MAEYNYFDLLKLKPFPKLPGKEEIEDAIRKWQRDTTKMANSSGTPTDRKRELNEMLRTLPPLLMAFAGDKKAQDDQRTQYRDQHCAQLAIMADHLKKNGGAQIREAALRRIARQSGLSPDDVIKVFQSADFDIQKSSASGVMLPKASDLAVIDDNLMQLRNAFARGVGAIPNTIGSVKNLYEYLEAILGSEEYKKINTKDFKSLCAQFRSLSVLHARGQEPYYFYRNIESKATTTFFGNAQSKASYDLYVRLQSSGLSEALGAISGLPESVRIDPIFAKNWITSITQALDVSEEDAYRIYNECCSIPLEEALEKEDTQVITICSCGHRNIHESLEIAKREKCSNCGIELYKPCPSCGEKVRNSAEFCPKCNYHLDDKAKFDRAVSQCRAAIARKNNVEARKQLSIAVESKPDKISLSDLEAQVSALEKSIGTAMSKIEQLILNGKLNDALREMTALRQGNPGVDLKALEQKIENKRKEIAGLQRELDQKMRLLNGRTPREQVNLCMDILSRDESYAAALQHLRQPSMAPRPVSAVQVTIDASGSTVSIAWTPHPENTYVTYTVVRTNTPMALMSPKQGTVVAENLKVAACRDSKAEAGAPLYYTVFAVRDVVGNWSPGGRNQAPAYLLPGLRKFEYTIVNADCVLQWDAPSGCAGVRLERATAGQLGRWETLQSLCLGRSFTDKNLRMNTQYTYRCTPVWNIAGRQIGSPQSKTVNVSLEKKPEGVSMNLREAQQGGYVEVVWKTSNQGQMEIWALNPGNHPKPGTVMEYRDLNTMGTSVWKGTAVSQRANFNIGANRECTLVAASSYGSQVVLGESILVSTIQPLSVSWETFHLNDDQLTVRVALPSQLRLIMVFLDTPVKSRKDLMNAKPYSTITPTERGETNITIANLPQREVEVAIAGVMTDGAVIPASVCKVNNKPKAPVTYLLEWRRGGIFHRNEVNGLSVTVKVKGQTTPHVLLCYNTSNPTIPISLHDNSYLPDRMTVLLDIPEGRIGTTTVQADEQTVKRLPQGTRLKLLLASDVLSGYRKPEPINAMALTKP